MAKKQNAFDFEIAFDADIPCDKCDTTPAADFAGETLCMNCVAKDVFEDYKTEEN